MPAMTGVPHAVRIVRFLTQFVTASLLLGLTVWFYHFATKPYQVRLFVEPSPTQPRTLQASVYSAEDMNTPLLVTVDCRREIEDLTYRPALEESRLWSLRELLPAVAETRPFVTATPSIDQIADRHLLGGLADWGQLQRSNLDERVKTLLHHLGPKLTQPQVDNIAAGFLSLPNRHKMSRLGLPPALSQKAQSEVQSELNRVEEEWERDVASVTTAWLQRWQALTGTTLLVPLDGIGGTTPVYLSIPSLKEGSGVTFGVVRESPLLATPTQEIKASIAEGNVYQVVSSEDLKAPSVLLVAKDHPELTALLLLFVVLAAAVFLSYRTWPKRLSDPDLYNRARRYKSDELWMELRRRNSWVEPYIVNSFLIQRAGIPGPEVIAYFWQTVSEALNTTHADADTPLQVKLAIQTTLDLAIQNAIA